MLLSLQKIFINSLLSEYEHCGFVGKGGTCLMSLDQS